MKPPRSKLRGIQQLSRLTQIIWVAVHVTADIHLPFPVLLHIRGSFLHSHVALLYWHNIHQTKIPLPTISASLPVLVWIFLSLSNSSPFVWSLSDYMSVRIGLENGHDPCLSLSRWIRFDIALLFLDTLPSGSHPPFDLSLPFYTLRDTHNGKSIRIHCGSFSPACSSPDLTLLLRSKLRGNALFWL